MPKKTRPKNERSPDGDAALHKTRCDLGNKLRIEWSNDHLHMLIPNMRDLSEDEAGALLLSCVADGETAAQKDVEKIFEMAQKAMSDLAVFQMAMLGLINLRLDKEGGLTLQMTKKAGEELGPQIQKIMQERE